MGNVGKTSVIQALRQEQPKDENDERSVVILSEQYSQQLQSIKGELISLKSEEHATLLQERVEGIEQINDWAIKLGPASRRSRGLFFVFERFHLNHRLNYGDSERITDLEGRLADLGGVCFLLIVSSDRMLERLEYRDGDRLKGQDLKQICEQWFERQKRMVQDAQKAQVPTVIINTDSMQQGKTTPTLLDKTA